MRKIKIIEHVSLDGVIQGPGGPEEDCDGNFDFGGWAFPFGDEASGQAIVTSQGNHFDLLLGRKTYNIFAGHWPHQSDPMADNLNAATKYVATSQPETLAWGPVEALGPDTLAAVRNLKTMDRPDLIVWGSSTLVPMLIEHGLADEILLLVIPVMLGTGKRIFSDKAQPSELSLIHSKATSSGLLINYYKTAGALRTGSY